MMRILSISILLAGIGAVFGVGVTGMLIGVPMSFHDWLPGQPSESLQTLPRMLLVGGICGSLIGAITGFSSQLTGKRIGYWTAGFIVTAFAVVTVFGTHPNLNVDVDSTIFDYLNSYRLTILATLLGGIAVISLGWLARLFQSATKHQSTE